MKKDVKFKVYLLLIMGIICIVYGVFIFANAGFTSMFHAIWFVMGVFFVFLSYAIKQVSNKAWNIPTGIWKGCWILFFVCLAFFVFVEGILVYNAFQKPDKDIKNMIILGCQVRGKKVSRALEYRLDVAIPYLEENENTKVIVSGGQGFGEDISEAEAMRRYLVNAGIDEKRITMEEQSTSTVENIMYSAELLDSREDYVVIVSNGFHMYRALGICKKQGLNNVQGLAGSSDYRMAATYYLREFFAVVKEKLTGNI